MMTAVGGKALDLAVRGDDLVELAHVLHAGAHHAGTLDAVTVVGEGDRALHDHVADLRERLALLAHRERADGAHVAEAGVAGAVDLVADLGTVVGHGVGVRHGGNVVKPPWVAARAPRLYGLLVLEAGVAEVDVHVHEPGTRYLPAGVDDLGPLRRLEGLGHRGDLLALDEHVTNAVEAQLTLR